MSKCFVCLACLLFSSALRAQRGDELLVYAVKGKVTAIFKNQETPVKIGKVLLPGAVVKTQQDAFLTMLCPKGKPISLTKAGSFPVTRWKDSCKTTRNSLTSTYFKYIWDQLYSYSPEHKEELRKRNDMAVARGDPPLGLKPGRFTRIAFSKGLDSLYYDGSPFPLSWQGSGYRGYYHFTVYDEKGQTVIFKDSMRNNFIAVDSFRHVLEEGKSYRWAVSAAGVPASKKRVLTFLNRNETYRLAESFSQPLDIPEDSATICFRVAYMLEQRHFLAEAYAWYIKAAEQNPEMELYRDQLIRFRNEYWIR
jgi:hypothetical protein